MPALPLTQRSLDRDSPQQLPEGFAGVATYSREFTIPGAFSASTQRLVLRFESANYRAAVHVDGQQQPLLTHSFAGMPFEVELPPSVVKAGAPGGGAVSLGLVRKVTSPSDGTTVAKCVAFVLRERVCWEVLEQHGCKYTLKGKAPRKTIELADMHAIDLALAPARPVGTMVTLRYECDGVDGGWSTEDDMRSVLADGVGAVALASVGLRTE